MKTGTFHEKNCLQLISSLFSNLKPNNYSDCQIIMDKEELKKLKKFMKNKKKKVNYAIYR